jgi:hypothetical protein
MKKQKNTVGRNWVAVIGTALERHMNIVCIFLCVVLIIDL